MASGLHETFLGLLEFELLRQLDGIRARGDVLGLFAAGIRPTRSKTLTWKSEEDGRIIRHNPDGSYCHDRAEYPGVIIEASYSQKRKDLSGLAEDYILESNSSIQLVVGIDFDYRGSKEAMILMWRPRWVISDQDGDMELISEQVLCEVG